MTSQTALRAQTLRIPRGLWADLEETVIAQDRIFLTEVARSLGLPVQEVLRRCLGTGAAQSVPVLWADDDPVDGDQCPWWECYGDGLWRRCPRIRLSQRLPCHIHDRCVPCPLTLHDSDPTIRQMPEVVPVRWEERLYWMDPTGRLPVFREDGTIETGGRFKYIEHEGEQILVWVDLTQQSPD